jgi:hypothetical protein
MPFQYSSQKKSPLAAHLDTSTTHTLTQRITEQGGLFELDIRPASPLWRNLSSLVHAPSARYGHAMVGINGLVFLFGGVYERGGLAGRRNVTLGDATLGGNTSSLVLSNRTSNVSSSNKGYASGSVYVLATFEERLFLPQWLDLSQFSSNMPTLTHHSIAALGRSIWIQVPFSGLKMICLV